MGIVNKYNKTGKVTTKKDKILILQSELRTCNEQISGLKDERTATSSKSVTATINHQIDLLLNRKAEIRANLAKLGHVERRGRPRKQEFEKYDYTRKKFTAMLMKNNLEYLKYLKDNHKIDNISDFLDTLIHDYNSNNNDLDNLSV